MTSLHTPSEQVKTVHQISAAITAASTNGAGCDCQGFENAKGVFYAAPSGGGTTSDCKLQESSDNASWADVPNGAFTQVTTASGAKVYTMDITLSKRLRYLRLVHTGAGGSAAGQTYALFELYNCRYNPVSQANPAKSV